MSNMEKIIGKPALLEQLAEEASELAQAALKQARVLRHQNPTPVTEIEAATKVIEEFTDVVHCASELNLVVDEAQITYKSERWLNRIKSEIIK